MIVPDRRPATTDAIANGLVRVAEFALMADRWNEDFLVEIRAHSLDDLMIEKTVGLWLATEDAPLAPSASFNLGFARFVAIFQPSEFARGDDFGYPQCIALCLVRGHATLLLVLLAIFSEYVEATDPIRRFDGHHAVQRPTRTRMRTNWRKSTAASVTGDVDDERTTDRLLDGDSAYRK
jgi:hypothetical protein